MAEGYFVQEGGSLDYVPAAATAAGQVIQFPDGRAAVSPAAIDAGALGAVQVCGVVRVAKAAGWVPLPGGRVYWDHSANAASYKKVNDRDFYMGRVLADGAAADETVDVVLNIDPPYDIDLVGRDGALSVATGTVVAGAFGLPVRFGASIALSLTATNEVQCVDLLSVDRFAVGANPIAEFVLRIGANGSNNTVDLSVGLANGTSTSDADTITESVLFHVDGGSTAILAESDDGTTEVAATDTTATFTAGAAVANRVELWIDGRDPADMRFYVNGAEVLNGTANLGNIALAAGPLGLLVHLEKSTGTATAGPVYVDRACVRLQE